ncbi:MAG: chemotaxis protein CheC [Hydrogenoanaerobacterium sp.]
MPISDYSELNSMHLDVLREIGNIGTGNAATSLASMLSKPVNIQVPKINILDYTEVTNELGGPEQMIVGMLLALSGDVTGMMMFLLQQDFAHMVLNALLGESFTNFSEVGEMGISALKEIGNIMAASYVNAISQLTNMEINISVPDICIDMAGAILSVPAIHFANISDKIIFIEDEFNSGEENAISNILLIPEVDSLQKIMKNLGIDL